MAYNLYKWNTNFHGTILTGSTRLPFQKFCFSQQFSTGTTQKDVFTVAFQLVFLETYFSVTTD